MNSLDVVRKLEKKRKLTLLERILAVTNGSVTQILEIAAGGPVKIGTVEQEVRDAGKAAGGLGLAKTDEVNFREVEIKGPKGRVLARAKSQTPLKRLEPGFREDLMKADVPIGKLLIKHRIEARRELEDAWMEGGKVRRIYNIIRRGEVLMRIEEEFGRLG